MNPKIFVGAAMGVIIVIIMVIAFSGQSIINDTSDRGMISSPENPPRGILPLNVEIETLEIAEINEQSAVIDVRFKISNPNSRSVILQFVKYQIFEGDLRIHTGQIGTSFEGFVEGSNFYTVLSNSHTSLSDKIILKNTGNTRLWEALSNSNSIDPNWSVTGEAFYNLSSITAGGENSVKFKLTR